MGNSDRLERVIIHEADDLCEVDEVIAKDFPVLKKNGFKYAMFFEACNGECYVYGQYTRGRAVRDALKNDGRAYDLSNGKKFF